MRHSSALNKGALISSLFLFHWSFCGFFEDESEENKLLDRDRRGL